MNHGPEIKALSEQLQTVGMLWDRERARDMIDEVSHKKKLTPEEIRVLRSHFDAAHSETTRGDTEHSDVNMVAPQRHSGINSLKGGTEIGVAMLAEFFRLAMAGDDVKKAQAQAEHAAVLRALGEDALRDLILDFLGWPSADEMDEYRIDQGDALERAPGGGFVIHHEVMATFRAHVPHDPAEVVARLESGAIDESDPLAPVWALLERDFS